MNSKKAKYFFSMLDVITKEFMGIFSIFSSRKKRMSSEFSHFEKSLSFEGMLFCPVKYCYLPGFYLWKDRHFWIPFEIFFFFRQGYIYHFLMLSAFAVPSFFPYGTAYPRLPLRCF